MSVDMDIAPPCVLIVDDDGHAVVLYRIMLGRYFPNVDILDVPTGREALQIIEDVSPRLVLLDAYVPDMDTFDLIKHIRSENADVAIFALLAYVYGDHLRRYEALCDEVFLCPLHFERFNRAIGRCLPASAR